ncbi:hypothetical protein QOT17_000962 [Balamuthia mandrillaris]
MAAERIVRISITCLLCNVLLSSYSSSSFSSVEAVGFTGSANYSFGIASIPVTLDYHNGSVYAVVERPQGYTLTEFDGWTLNITRTLIVSNEGLTPFPRVQTFIVPPSSPKVTPKMWLFANLGLEVDLVSWKVTRKSAPFPLVDNTNLDNGFVLPDYSMVYLFQGVEGNVSYVYQFETKSFSLLPQTQTVGNGSYTHFYNGFTSQEGTNAYFVAQRGTSWQGYGLIQVDYTTWKVLNWTYTFGHMTPPVPFYNYQNPSDTFIFTEDQVFADLCILNATLATQFCTPNGSIPFYEIPQALTVGDGYLFAASQVVGALYKTRKEKRADDDDDATGMVRQLSKEGKPLAAFPLYGGYYPNLPDAAQGNHSIYISLTNDNFDPPLLLRLSYT